MPFISNYYLKFRNYFSVNFPKIYNFCDSRKSIIKFFIAGCFSGGADLILLFIFHGLLKMNIVLSTSLAFILSFLISFTLQKLWTFRNYSQNKIVHQLLVYVLNAFLGLYINGLLMHLLVNRYQVWYILAQIVVNLTIAVWNFIVYKFIVFKIGKNETTSQ